MTFKYFTVSALALSTAAPAHAADIEFWYGNTGRIEEAIQAQCEAFNAAQDEHTITCVGQGGYEAGMQKAIAAYRSGEHPVLIQFFDAGTLDLMLSDAVVPVHTLFEDVDWGDYNTGAKGYYQTSTGDLFSQPYNGSTLIFYANMEMLGAVGVTEVPGTWEEVIETARALKEAGVDCPFSTDAHPWRVLEQFSARHGAPIASNDNGYGGLDAEYTFNRGIVADHLNNLAAWREEGLVKLNADTETGHYFRAFTGGECAMAEGSTGADGGRGQPRHAAHNRIVEPVCDGDYPAPPGEEAPPEQRGLRAGICQVAKVLKIIFGGSHGFQSPKQLCDSNTL